MICLEKVYVTGRVRYVWTGEYSPVLAGLQT